MVHSLIISFIAVLCAYLSRYKSCKFGLEIAFLILIVFMGIRYEWGNDYSAYLQIFYNNTFTNEFSAEYLNDILSDENSEFGWKLINMLFKPFGFFFMVFILTTLEYWVLYTFIKKYVNVKYYWFAVFIFTFNSGLMLTGGSMMRQFLAMNIILLAFKYIINGNFTKYLFCVILSSSIHTSSLLLVPFYFIRFIPQFFSSKSYGLIILFSFIYQKLLPILFISFLTLILSIPIFSRYDVYSDNNSLNSGFGLGVLYYYIVFFIALKSGRYLPRKIYLLVIMGSLYVIFIPFTNIIPLIGRIGYYFTYFSTLSLPILIEKMPSKWGRIILASFSIVFILKLWISFFYSETWKDSMMEYKSIFSAPFWM